MTAPRAAVLSVVLGTWNRLPQLQACLASIREQTRTPFRIYVADAGSTDGTVEYLREKSRPDLVAVFAGKRVGQARAYNDVFEALDTPYTCWLSDDDVVVNAGLDTAVGILKAHPDLAMVGLKTRDVRGPFVHAAYIGGVSSAGILNVNQGVLRTAVLREVGYFSEAFVDYGIDADLTAKVLLSGHGVALTRKVALHHHRNLPADVSSAAYQRHQERQQRYFRLYRKKYAAFVDAGRLWKGRRGAWWLLRRLLAGRLRDDTMVLGMPVRDWQNLVTCRYTRLLDPLLTRGQAFHLVQRCPPRARPATLPPEVDGA